MDDPKYTRTGNFMISRRIVDENADLFDPAFGRTGGEDVDFFRRMMRRGYRFVWADEARAVEAVTPERFKKSFLLRRALLRGVAGAKAAPLTSRDTAKSVAAVAIYTFSLPFLLPVRFDLFMKVLVSDCDHIGKVLARLGISVVKERD